MAETINANLVHAWTFSERPLPTGRMYNACQAVVSIPEVGMAWRGNSDEQCAVRLSNVKEATGKVEESWENKAM